MAFAKRGIAGFFVQATRDISLRTPRESALQLLQLAPLMNDIYSVYSFIVTMIIAAISNWKLLELLLLLLISAWLLSLSINLKMS